MILGAIGFALARELGWPVPAAIGADTFFAVFLLLGWWLVFTLSDDDLEKHADIEDEGAIVVTLITLAAVGFSSFAIFTVLNARHAAPLAVWLTLAGAPLSWFMLHTINAFRYAHLHYSDDDKPDYVAPLKFPECGQPGPWDFVYFAFVIGMTAQVSDTVVQTSAMRRAVLLHSVVSFFFNTVLIAMAVNAAVTLAA